MRSIHAAVFLSVLCALAGFAAGTAGKAAPVKAKAVVKTKKAPAKAAAKGGPVKRVAAKGPVAKGKKAPAASWRTRQMSPTSDRYKEIQQALVMKGYLKSEPTGVWDADSIGAMQRFQMDQKMTANGRINAPSLIGLGLGAKSAGAPEAPALPGAPPPPASPPQ